MNVKKRVFQILWVAILVAFVSLQLYNYTHGNYFDLLITGLIMGIAGLLLVAVIWLSRNR